VARAILLSAIGFCLEDLKPANDSIIELPANEDANEVWDNFQNVTNEKGPRRPSHRVDQLSLKIGSSLSEFCTM
jgi:hypothetical protein